MYIGKGMVPSYGGGISVDGNIDNGATQATVRLLTTDANNPAQIHFNTASHNGGGIYLKPCIGSSYLGRTTLCAFDFRIENNNSQEGTGIYADADHDTLNNAFLGGSIRLNSDSNNECSTPETIGTLGSATCTSGAACNTVSGNVAESGNLATPGSAILAQTDADLQADRRWFGPDPDTGLPRISNCLIADNTLSEQVIRVEDDGNGEGGTTIDGCTIVNNGNPGGQVIHSAHALTLTNSIIDQSGSDTLIYAGPGGGLNAGYVLATDTSTLPSAPDIIQGQPSYVDAGNQDYHLRPTSAGIDFAPANGGQDLDGNARDVDLAPIPNVFGPRDIGAYERQNMFQCGTSDSIFCNATNTPGDASGRLIIPATPGVNSTAQRPGCRHTARTSRGCRRPWPSCCSAFPRSRGWRRARGSSPTAPCAASAPCRTARRRNSACGSRPRRS